MLKQIRLFFALALSSFLILGACNSTQNATATATKEATKAAPINTLLWKVEGNGITTPSYLYGTIHMISQDDFFMNEATKKAVESSEQIVLELDMDDPGMQMQLMQHAMMKDGLTLDKLVTEEEYQKIDAEVKGALGMGVEMFKSMSPMLISSLFLTKMIEGQPASYEGEFVKLAQAQSKEVKGLETVAEQMGALNKISYEEQAKMLVETVNDMSKAKAEFAKLVSLYKTQNIDGLHDMILEQSGGQDMAKHMLYTRNQDWISKIGTIAKEKPTFFGVGSGHLGGKKGVVSLLKEAGYKVTPIQ